MRPAPELKIDRSITKGLKLFSEDRFRWLDEAAEIGPLVALRMGPVRTWIVTDPELARTVLVTDSASWMRPPATTAPIRVGVGENLFTQSDKAWAVLQPSVAPAFRRKAVDERLAGIDALIDSEVDAIPLDTSIDLELAMGRVALMAAAWVLLGEELDRERAEEIAHHQREVVRWVGERLGELTGFIPLAFGKTGAGDARAPRGPRCVRRGSDHSGSGERSRRRRRAGRAARGAARREDADSRKQLRGHVLGLFLAGNETTQSALSWVLVDGARAPDEWAKVRDDPDACAMPFITESLRLTPAVWGIPRVPTTAGVSLASGDVSTRVRRGQLATVYLRAINRDPVRWEDPMRFDPSRHAGASKEQQRALIPFGLGPRGCIGQHLALAEMNAVLRALARRGDVEVEGPVAEDPSFALRVRGGLRGRFVAPFA